ncbi:ABC transporter permease [uncultured Corynebacterium sp.]|uniref:ABC transporter permease n=1 Tax=uncultured Corynebacterium sp. TaxID=159447 RepID=UPI0025EDBC86|nr:ABC transporter permease [uncultured Corynebacterium sp.]
MVEFISSRWTDILFKAYQHASLVIQSVAIATIIALAVAVLVTRYSKLAPFANAFSAIGLTLPSFALLGLLIPLMGIGTMPAVLAVVFYAALPILRNAVVGLQAVDPVLVESARGQGMGALETFFKVEFPLAWPVIMTGIRVSTQMSMGVAAIAAYVLGPGFGSYIFRGLAQAGGQNAMYYAIVGTVGVVIVALIVDAALILLGRITTSKGIR